MRAFVRDGYFISDLPHTCGRISCHLSFKCINQGTILFIHTCVCVKNSRQHNALEDLISDVLDQQAGNFILNKSGQNLQTIAYAWFLLSSVIVCFPC